MCIRDRFAVKAFAGVARNLVFWNYPTIASHVTLLFVMGAHRIVELVVFLDVNLALNPICVSPSLSTSVEVKVEVKLVIKLTHNYPLHRCRHCRIGC